MNKRNRFFINYLKSISRILALLLLIFVYSASSQSNLKERFKLGESYEKGGDLENAGRIYLEIYQSEPRSEEYFAAVLRVYTGLAKYSELKDIIAKRISLFESPQLYAIYGEILWKTGNTIDANSAWESALTKFHPQYENFIAVSDAQSRLKLVDKAINTLLRGRKTLNFPTVFSNELSQLYIATGNYEDGTEEVLNFFREHKHITFAQGRLYALMTSDKASNYILSRLRKEAESNGNDIFVQELYSFILRTAGNYDESFRIIIRIDELKNAEGREILYFADRSRQDEQYIIALKAYSHIIDLGKGNKYFTAALYGYARTLERKIAVEGISPFPNGKINPADPASIARKQEIETIIDRYLAIANDYPNIPEAPNSLYQVAILYHKFLGNSDNSLKYIKKLIEKYPRTSIAISALNLEGDIYLSQNKIDEAKGAFERAVRLFGNATNNSACDYAEYKLAEIEYFRGNILLADSLLRKVSNKIGSDAANDALEKIVLIEQNKQFNEALRLFAQAELLELQNKISDAIILLKQVAGLVKGETIAEISLLKVAKLELIVNQSISASRAIIQEFILAYPESIFGDQAYMILANTYIIENQKEEAIKHLTHILTNYPKSILANETREKIRKLRDEKL